MDDLKKKLNGLFKSKGSSSSSSSRKNFKGHGQKLGSAPTSDTHHHPAQRAAPPAASKPRRPTAPTSTQSLPSQPLSAVSGYQPPPPPKLSSGQPPAPATTSGQAPSLSEEGAVALGLLVSGEKGHLASAMLRKVFGNIVSDPSNEKYHRLRMLNAKVQETITGVPGGLELLVAGGFDVVFETSEDGSEEGWAVWRSGSDSFMALKSCVAALDRSFPQQAGAVPQSGVAASQAAVPAQPQPRPQATAPVANSNQGVASGAVDRCTRIYLPQANPSAQQHMGEEFFKRSTSEWASDAKARAAAREAQSMLTTKAWKEKQKGPKVAYNQAQIRVRMPDGLLLEGQFGAKEPTSAIYQWVSDALRHPWGEYDLYILHQKLQRDGPQDTVAKQDLCPNALLNFRWKEHNDTLEGASSLKDEVLVLAEAVPTNA